MIKKKHTKIIIDFIMTLRFCLRTIIKNNFILFKRKTYLTLEKLFYIIILQQLIPNKFKISSMMRFEPRSICYLPRLHFLMVTLNIGAKVSHIIKWLIRFHIKKERFGMKGYVTIYIAL